MTSSGPATHFVCILQLDDGSALTIYTAICDRLKEWNIHLNKLVGFASDGASVMTGCQSGVAMRLRVDVPHMIDIHCVAHRLALATTKATESTLEVKQFETVIKDVYNYFGHSTTRRVELQLWQSVYDDPVITIKGFSSTRWLSVYNSIQSIARSYSSLLAFFAMESIGSSAANGIYLELQKWRCAALTVVLGDILGVLNTLSKKFQQDDIPLPRLLSIVESVKRELTARYLGKEPRWALGYREWYTKYGADGKMGETTLVRQQFDDQYLQTTVRQFVSSAIDALVERFPSASFVEAVQVIDPCKIPSDDESKVDYGEEYIHTLCVQFPCLDEALLLCEWNLFKFDSAATSPSALQKSLWDFYYPHRVLYPVLWKLVQLLLTIPINSAACERGFSKMKIVKTDRRNRLSTEQLNSLMTVSLSNPLLKDDVLISRAIGIWHKQKRRRFSSTPSINSD